MKIDLNLDDEEECTDFILKYRTLKGRALANRLGLKGRGSVAAANALSNYAWNKRTATFLRLAGEIESAQKYEKICDWIYSEDISGKIECW